MSDLEGKVVIITGVGRPRGVGRAAALRYAGKGAKLVLADLGSSDNAIGDIEGTSPDLNRVAAEVAAAGVMRLLLRQMSAKRQTSNAS